jgi:hypothetical protein
MTMGEAKRRRAAAAAGFGAGRDYSTGEWAFNMPMMRRHPELARKFIEVFERIP